MTITAVRGTQDLLPGRSGLWQEVEHRCRRHAGNYGFHEIRTPMFEKADLFVRGLGVMAGLVERDLWTFHDKHGQKLALRADLTASVVRAYVEHGLGGSAPTRLYYLAQVFLLGKESGEGSRQAHQFGVEVLGCENPALDAELIAMASELVTNLGLPEVSIELNTLGCERCRPAYHDCLRDFYNGHQAELCGTCKRKYKTHPTWTLSCPESACVQLAQVSPTIYGLLCQDCKAHFHMVKHLVRELNLPCELNPRVVKDVDYYNRTTFQILSRGEVVGNGGRYDGLVEQLGGPDTAGIGFGLHLEPIVEIMSEQLEEMPDELEVLLIPEGEEATKVLMPVLHRLRQAGVRAEMAYTGQHPSSRYVGRLVEANALRGHAQIEDLDHGDVEKVSPDRLTPRLLARLGLDEGSTADSRNSRRKLTRSQRPQRGRNGASSDHPAPADARDLEDSSGRRRRRRRRRRGEEGPEESVETAAVGRREEREEREGGRRSRGLRSRGDRIGGDRGEREAGRGRGDRDRDRGEGERDRSERDGGRGRGERDRGERDGGRGRGDRDRSERESEGRSDRDRSEREGGRERSDRDRGERDGGRGRGERDRGERDGGRGRGERDRSERDAEGGRGRSERDRDRGEREEGGRERVERDRDRGERDTEGGRGRVERDRDRGEREEGARGRGERDRDRGEREGMRERGDRDRGEREEGGRGRGERDRDRGERDSEGARTRGERDRDRDRGEERESVAPRGRADSGERDGGEERAPRRGRAVRSRSGGEERAAGGERPDRDRAERDGGEERGSRRGRAVRSEGDSEREGGRDRADRDRAERDGAEERDAGRGRADRGEERDGERETARGRAERDRDGGERPVARGRGERDRNRGERDRGEEREGGRGREDSGKAFIPALILASGARSPAAPTELKRASTATSIEAPPPAKVANWSILPGSKKKKAEPEAAPAVESEPKASAPRRRSTRTEEPAQRAARARSEEAAAPEVAATKEKAPARRSTKRAKRSEETQNDG